MKRLLNFKKYTDYLKVWFYFIIIMLPLAKRPAKQLYAFQIKPYLATHREIFKED